VCGGGGGDYFQITYSRQLERKRRLDDKQYTKLTSMRQIILLRFRGLIALSSVEHD